MSSPSKSSSPCGGCKYFRRRCDPGCVFACFLPDQDVEFGEMHCVFGAHNAGKLLKNIHPAQRFDAANSLVFEAEARLQDPVHGCVRYISALRHRIHKVHNDLQRARSDLYTSLGPAVFNSFYELRRLRLQQRVAAPPPQQQVGVFQSAQHQPAVLDAGVHLLRKLKQQQQQLEAAQILMNAWAEAAREMETLQQYQHNELPMTNQNEASELHQHQFEDHHQQQQQQPHQHQFESQHQQQQQPPLDDQFESQLRQQEQPPFDDQFEFQLQQHQQSPFDDQFEFELPPFNDQFEVHLRQQLEYDLEGKSVLESSLW